MRRLADIKANMRRKREARRRLLTRGERIVAWTLAFAPSALLVVGVAMLLSGAGATQIVGIALLILALVAMTVPISPILRARVWRREARSARRQ